MPALWITGGKPIHNIGAAGGRTECEQLTGRSNFNLRVPVRATMMGLLALCRAHTVGCTLNNAVIALNRTPQPLLRQYLPRGHRKASYTNKDSSKLLLDSEYAVQKDTVLYRNDNKKFYR